MRFEWVDDTTECSRFLQKFNQWNSMIIQVWGLLAMKLCWFLLMYRGEKIWTWWYWRHSGIVSARDLLFNMDWSVMFVMFIKDNAGPWFWSFSKLHVCLDLVRRLTIYLTVRTCHLWGLTACPTITIWQPTKNKYSNFPGIIFQGQIANVI